MERSIKIDQRYLRFAAACLIGGLLIPAHATNPTDDVQKTVAEWAKVRAETTRLDSDWVWQQALMQSTLEALQGRARQFEAKRAELEARTAEERRETAELTARQQTMKEAEAEAARHLRQLSDRLTQMRAWLPPRLSAALELPYRTLVTPDTGTSERMRQAMAIVNRCVQFNRIVSTGEEMIAAPHSEKRLMEVVYWGLSHGYALDRVAGEAYLGAPTEAGWTWTPLPGMARQVTRLLAASRDKAEPVFVLVPAQANDPVALNPKL